MTKNTAQGNEVFKCLVDGSDKRISQYMFILSKEANTIIDVSTLTSWFSIVEIEWLAAAVPLSSSSTVQYLKLCGLVLKEWSAVVVGGYLHNKALPRRHC